MVRSGVDGSAAGATAAMPDAANCEPSPDGGDVAGFREADVHLRPALFFGVIEFFHVSLTRRVANTLRMLLRYRNPNLSFFCLSLFFLLLLFLRVLRATPLAFFSTPSFGFHRLTTVDTGFFSFFFLLFYFARPRFIRGCSFGAFA
jgi:hypothetical protein